MVPCSGPIHALFTWQVVLQCGERVVDRGVGVVDEIGGDKVLYLLQLARGLGISRLHDYGLVDKNVIGCWWNIVV